MECVPERRPSLLYKYSRAFAKSLAREESWEARIRRGGCEGVKSRCGFSFAVGFSLDARLSLADRFSAGLFSFAGGFSFVGQLSFAPDPRPYRRMPLLCRVGAGRTSFSTLCRGGMTAVCSARYLLMSRQGYAVSGEF